MTYNEFLNEIRTRAQERLGKTYHVCIENVMKNNGIMKDALCMNKKGDTIAPVVYLNSYYNLYLENMTLDDILNEIMEVYEWNERRSVGWYGEFKDFKEVKDKIIFKLVNAEKNKELLSNVPFIPYLDLAIVFYIFKETEENALTGIVRTEHLEFWKIEQEKLFEAARENTPLLLPAKISSLNDVIKEIVKDTMGDKDTIDNLLHINDEPAIFVLNNVKKVFGSACILYKDVLEDFAEQVGSDLIILPSSIHEVLLIPVNGTEDISGLRNTVTMVNDTQVPSEDILSNDIYYFSRKDGTISFADEGKQDNPVN